METLSFIRLKLFLGAYANSADPVQMPQNLVSHHGLHCLPIVQPTLVVSTSIISNNHYLEEKIWSLFKHRNLTSGNKILWIRGEISPQEQFLPFLTTFSMYISN